MEFPTNTTPVPLFEIPMAPLPGEPVLLHLFEPRYRDMLERMEAGEAGYGHFVIQSADVDLPAVASLVRLERVLERHDDGTIDAIFIGGDRVNVLSRDLSVDLGWAYIQPFNDESGSGDDDGRAEVAAIHRQWLLRVVGDEPPASLYEPDGDLSWRIATFSGVDLNFRDVLLRSDSENERLRQLKDLLNTMLPLLDQLVPAMQTSASQYLLYTKVLNTQSPEDE